MKTPRPPKDADERRPHDSRTDAEAADDKDDRDEEDSPLESLGKAVSAPVRGAADPDADEKPQ